MRDGRCVISGIANSRLRVSRGEWSGLEAAHIFPLEKEDPVWIQGNYGRWITDMDDTNGVSKIDSVQNGFLLMSNVHQLFDQYLVSINPDVSASSID